MQQKIIDFTNLLRKSGVRVSVAEAIDAFEALDQLPLEDREIFRDALRSTMVKRGDDIPTFDQLFELFWSSFYDSLKNAFEEAGADGVGGFRPEDLLEMLQAQMQQMGGDMDLSALAEALLMAHETVINCFLREIVE